MKNLIPAELWEYNVSDIIRCLSVALRSKQLSELLPIEGLGNCIPVRSGRAGIFIALKALELPVNARIGVPLYTCPAVLKAIEAAGYKPSFIDIDPLSYCMSVEDLSSKRSQFEAAIVIHMFGNICDMQGLLDAAQGKPIIEDCAQAIGSKINGKMVGSFGTAAVFSFRSGKYLAVGEGGAVFTNNKEIGARVTRLVDAMPSASLISECFHIAKTYLRSKLRTKPFYGIIGYHLWSAYNKKTTYTAKTPIKICRIYEADISTTINRLRYIDSAIKKQRANADYYTSSLKLNTGMLCSEKPGMYYNRYLYPILFSSTKQRDLMVDFLFKRKIGTIKPYNDSVDVGATSHGYTGDCMVTERISKRLLAIPCYYKLKRKELEYIARCVNEGWEKIMVNRKENSKEK